jgi:MFS family permease
MPFHLNGGKIRNKVVTFALIFNTLSWYILGLSVVTEIRRNFDEESIENVALGIAYPSFIIVSAILGSIFLARIRRIRFFRIWLVIGVFATLSFAFIAGSSFFGLFVATSVLGISLGIGTPLCLSYFSELFPLENRGKTGGIAFLATLSSTPFILAQIAELDFMYKVLIVALWRMWCLPLLFFISEEHYSHRGYGDRISTLTSVFLNNTFLLYFIAWLMFAFIDSFGTVVIDYAIGDFRLLLKIIEPVSASLSALIAGFLCDYAGRKRILIFGFVSLGMAYAVLGLMPQFWISWIIFFISDGIALGSLWVILVIVLWGDIAKSSSEKFYAVGGSPFFLTQIFSLLLSPYLAMIPPNSLFSLASFFLFLAVVPLMFAPETLPEKAIRERELRSYIEKAKRVREKFTKG